MDARDVLDVLAILDEDGVDVVVHGGWGIDALVGSQDRDHDDVDLLVSVDQLPAAVTSLGVVGFSVTYDIETDGGPATVTMTDRSGRRVDLTSLRDEADEIRWLGSGRKAIAFPPSAFTDGWLGGRLVRCVAAIKQIELHADYPPRDRDHHDMTSLHGKFGVLLPAEYR